MQNWVYEVSFQKELIREVILEASLGLFLTGE